MREHTRGADAGVKVAAAAPLSGTALRRAALALLAWAAFATGFLGAERAFRAGAPTSLLAGAAVAGVFLLLLADGGERVARAVRRLADRAARVPAGAWVADCVALGTALRLAWGSLLVPRQVSDMEIYYELARSLAERGVFEHEGDRVFGPPGISLLLAPLVKLLGAGTWLPLAVNVALAAGTVLVVAALARRLAGERAMRVAALLVAVWPNQVLLSGLVSKELLVLFLLPLATLLYLRGTEGGGLRAGTLLGAGLAAGAATLAQPNTLVLLPAFAGLEALRRTPWRAAAARLGLLAAGTALAVSPWTVRNHLLFGRFIPVSLNFGHSMLVGNHPGADGGFQPVRTPYLGMPEVDYDRMALRMALDWIAANPGRFLALVPRKQMIFLGDDGDGAYHALKWAYGIGDARYAAAKAVSNAFWLGVLVLAAAGLSGRRGRAAEADPRLGLLVLFFLCLLALLSVTESGARHHIALSGFLAVFAGLAAGREEAPPG
jgi:4-amino-4-deoxy-L-arabinose transferase-like glycosyltransferase